MRRVLRAVAPVALVSFGLSFTHEGVSRAQGTPNLPWMNTSLTPEQRADLLIPQMTLEQKVQQLSNDVRPAEDPANRPPGCKFQGSVFSHQGPIQRSRQKGSGDSPARTSPN
jgi:hypothetical protein